MADVNNTSATFPSPVAQLGEANDKQYQSRFKNDPSRLFSTASQYQ